MADDIKYDILPRERIEEVNELLLQHFFSNEPLGNRLGAVPEKDVKPWLFRVTTPLVDQGVSALTKLILG